MVSDRRYGKRTREHRVRHVAEARRREVHSGRQRNASGSEVVHDGIAKVLEAQYEMVLDAVCDAN